jgi:hypothetical protein
MTPIQKLAAVTEMVQNVFQAKMASNWLRLDGDTERYMVDLIRPDGSIHQKIIYDLDLNRLELFKNAGYIGFDETDDGYLPTHLTDKRLQPSNGVVLKCDYDAETDLFVIGFEGVEKSVGTKTTRQGIEGMVKYIQETLDKAKE